MRWICLTFFAAIYLYGQGTAEIMSLGYAPPVVQRAAPGQVIAFFVRGVNVPDATASGFPYPAVLSGLSVRVKVACCNPRTYPSTLPILRVHTEESCSRYGLAVACPLTQVTVQTPTEPLCVKTSFPNSCTMGPPGEIVLNVNVNGDGGQDFPLLVVPSAHFLNTCDTVMSGSGLCSSLVTHSDGSPVTTASPAKAGETIILRAAGLGYVDPSVPTGSPSKDPAFSISTQSEPMSVAFVPQLPSSSPPPQRFYVPEQRLFYPCQSASHRVTSDATRSISRCPSRFPERMPVPPLRIRTHEFRSILRMIMLTYASRSQRYTDSSAIVAQTEQIVALLIAQRDRLSKATNEKDTAITAVAGFLRAYVDDLRAAASAAPLSPRVTLVQK
jgi:hypothetical protein